MVQKTVSGITRTREPPSPSYSRSKGFIKVYIPAISTLKRNAQRRINNRCVNDEIIDFVNDYYKTIFIKENKIYIKDDGFSEREIREELTNFLKLTN